MRNVANAQPFPSRGWYSTVTKPSCLSFCFPSASHQQELLHLCPLYTLDNTYRVTN